MVFDHEFQAKLGMVYGLHDSQIIGKDNSFLGNI